MVVGDGKPWEVNGGSPKSAAGHETTRVTESQSFHSQMPLACDEEIHTGHIREVSLHHSNESVNGRSCASKGQETRVTASSKCGSSCRIQTAGEAEAYKITVCCIFIGLLSSTVQLCGDVILSTMLHSVKL